MKCPECPAEMRIASSEGHVGYRCAMCSGTWLPWLYISTVAHERRFDPAVFVAALHELRDGQSPVRCPSDGSLLECSHVHGIELDWCRRCTGVWFHAGELASLLAKHPQAPGTPLETRPEEKWEAVEAGLELLLELFFNS